MRLAPLLVVVALAPCLALGERAGPACPTRPIGLERLNAVIAAADPPPKQTSVPVGVRPVTSEETEALVALLDAFVACADAGEPLRVFALYTDGYLSALFYRQGQFTEEQYRALARPDPAEPGEETTVVSVGEVEALADGRVLGEAVIRYAVIPEPKRFLVTIARVEGTWRVDDILGELTFALP